MISIPSQTSTAFLADAAEPQFSYYPQLPPELQSMVVGFAMEAEKNSNDEIVAAQCPLCQRP